MTTQVARERRAQARYDFVRALAVGAMAVVVLAGLALLLLLLQDVRGAQRTTLENQRIIRELVEQNRAEALVIEALIERQQENDANRERLIAEAVELIAQQQRDALAEHDRSVKDFLGRTLQLVDQEVNAPSSQEDEPMRAPAVIAVPVPAVPRASPSDGREAACAPFSARPSLL